MWVPQVVLLPPQDDREDVADYSAASPEIGEMDLSV